VHIEAIGGNIGAISRNDIALMANKDIIIIVIYIYLKRKGCTPSEVIIPNHIHDIGAFSMGNLGVYYITTPAGDIKADGTLITPYICSGEVKRGRTDKGIE
jgi:hypothetical protein